MTEMENVILGLECCADGSDCRKCPYYDNKCRYGNINECTARLAADALELLKEQKTKTGKWIEQDGYDGDVYYDCSVCGESWVTIEGTPQENGMCYCPHCGAKMEGR